MNLRSELFGLIRIENSVWIILTSDSFGLTTSFGLIRIGSLGLDRIEFSLGLKIPDWLGLRRIDFQPIYIKRNWKLFSDWIGWVRIGADTDFGINRNNSDWFRINFNPKLLPGFRMVDFFHILIPLGSIRNIPWNSLFAGNITIHPP